jgi:hypothetical protein
MIFFINSKFYLVDDLMEEFWELKVRFYCKRILFNILQNKINTKSQIKTKNK